MKARIIGLGFGILLIIAAFGVVLWQGMNMPTTNVALAQAGATATPSASPTTAPSTAPQQTIGDSFWTILAGKLGVSADDLKAKALEARKEMLDQAVKDGRITQAQADTLKERLTSNNLIAPIPLPRSVQGGGQGQQQPGRGMGPWFGSGSQNPNRGPFGFPGMMFGRGMMGFSLGNLEAVAKALKLEPKALIEQLSQGKTLADIAKAQGVDEATVKQAIVDARKAQIDQLLAYGLLSEAQANQLKAQLTTDNIDLSRPWFWFRAAPGQKSSDLFPGFEMGETFGITPDDFEMFGQVFGFTPDQNLIPFGDMQTQ